MSIITSIGLLAAALTTWSFLPQVIKVWKTKQTKDISLTMYIVLLIGLSFWLIYGILLINWPLILSNIVTFLLAGIVLGLKLSYD